MMNKLELYPTRRFGWDGFGFYLYERDEYGVTAHAISVNMQSVPRQPSAIVEPNEPTFHLRYEQAQRLMDELWNCGLRPSEGMGSAGQLAATQKHLEDERALSRRLLDKVLEK
jgi:hypothetical protein